MMVFSGMWASLSGSSLSMNNGLWALAIDGEFAKGCYSIMVSVDMAAGGLPCFQLILLEGNLLCQLHSPSFHLGDKIKLQSDQDW